VAASAVGTSHITFNSNCQDSFFANVETNPGKPPLLNIFIADGAGGAALGGIGAELTIEAAAKLIKDRYDRTEIALNERLALECVKAIREKIDEEADRHASPTQDFACTFLGVVASPAETLLMQVGDGGIVVDVGDGLEAPITPLKGEYANMTYFVTDEDALDILIVKALPARADKVAAFTDGVQRLAMNMATNAAHEPFFAPFFAVLATATEDREDELRIELANFLQSPAVNSRTDDDKTLAFARWIG
jgi:hypothetical protein